MRCTTEARRALIRAELQRVDGADPFNGPTIDKHEMISASPMGFLRGTAQLFYADIEAGRLVLPESLVDGVPLTRVMGDCHISNFGFFTEEGSHGDRVVFCPNDYDDACVGRGVWDITRFCVSLFLASDSCRGVVAGDYKSEEVGDPKGLRAPDPDEAEDAARQFLGAYRKTCTACVAEPEHVYMRVLDDFGKSHVLRKPFEKAKRRAAGGEDFETESSLGKDVEIVDGKPRFRELPYRFESPGSARAEATGDAFRAYVDDEILDLVRRLGAGTGSVNVERYYLLVGPGDFAERGDLALCHIVEVKQQRPAAALYYFPTISPVNRLSPAHLTVDCQRLMQRRPDLVLDEVSWQGKHWLVRTRHHARVGIDPEDVCLGKEKPGKRLAQYAAACGEALALVHARGDRRSTRFEAAIADKLTRAREPIVAAARSYAEQTMEDCRLLREMIGNRRRDAANRP